MIMVPEKQRGVRRKDGKIVKLSSFLPRLLTKLGGKNKK